MHSMKTPVGGVRFKKGRASVTDFRNCLLISKVRKKLGTVDRRRKIATTQKPGILVRVILVSPVNIIRIENNY